MKIMENVKNSVSCVCSFAIYCLINVKNMPEPCKLASLSQGTDEPSV